MERKRPLDLRGAGRGTAAGRDVAIPRGRVAAPPRERDADIPRRSRCRRAVPRDYSEELAAPPRSAARDRPRAQAALAFATLAGAEDEDKAGRPQKKLYLDEPPVAKGTKRPFCKLRPL